MKIISLIFLLCLSHAVYGRMIDLSNLGADIERSVRESLSPLNGLGSRIQHQLAPLDNLGAQIGSQLNAQLSPLNNLGTQIHQQLAPLNNLGEHIQSEVNSKLAPLNSWGWGSRNQQPLAPRNNVGGASESQVNSNLLPVNYNQDDLGDKIRKEVQQSLLPLKGLKNRIEKEVEEGLLPLKAMAMVLLMINGEGGKTIVKYSDDITLLVKNGYHYRCSGTINNQGECSGSLSRLNVDKKENYCYLNPTVRTRFIGTNNYMCIRDGNKGISVTTINGVVSCSTSDNSPLLVILQEDYDKMCANKGRNAIYTYIADVNNPAHVKIPNDNPFFKCQKSEANICVFSIDLSI